MSYDLNFACGKTIDEVNAALEDSDAPDCTTLEQRREVAKRLMEAEDGLELYESANCIELRWTPEIGSVVNLCVQGGHGMG